MSLEIKVAGPADFSEILALNEACVPHVNAIGESEIAFFCKDAHQFRKVVEDGALAGFVIAYSHVAGFPVPPPPNSTSRDRTESYATS